MFILRIGAEALKNSDHGFCNHCCANSIKHSSHGKMKIKTNFQIDNYNDNDRPVDQGILYNLLNKNKIQSPKLDRNHNIEMNDLSRVLVNDRPNSSNLETVKLMSTNTSLRPSSAPTTVRFHPYCKPNKIYKDDYHKTHSERTTNIYPNQLLMDWLKNNILLMKPNKSNDIMLLSVYQLPDVDRTRILKQTWHLIFITYLVEFIQNSHETTESILSIFIKDYNKTEKSGNYKKLSRLTKVFTNDLEHVINQMISLKLNHNLLELLRIAILFTDNQEDIKKKNIELLKPILGTRSDEYHRLFDQLLENLFKLDVSMIESVFFSHLFQSVDSIIDELYAKL